MLLEQHPRREYRAARERVKLGPAQGRGYPFPKIKSALKQYRSAEDQVKPPGMHRYELLEGQLEDQPATPRKAVRFSPDPESTVSSA